MLTIKKLSSYLLAIILILALITGCSAPINDATQTKVENKSTAEIIETAKPQVSEIPLQTEKSKVSSSTEKITKTVIPQATEMPIKTATKAPDITTGSLLTVSYIDVGQGDSILIQSPNGKNMLIDAGESSSQTVVFNYLKDKGVKKIDVLVATHPHADQYGLYNRQL